MATKRPATLAMVTGAPTPKQPLWRRPFTIKGHKFELFKDGGGTVSQIGWILAIVFASPALGYFLIPTSAAPTLGEARWFFLAPFAICLVPIIRRWPAYHKYQQAFKAANDPTNPAPPLAPAGPKPKSPWPPTVLAASFLLVWVLSFIASGLLLYFGLCIVAALVTLWFNRDPQTRRRAAITGIVAIVMAALGWAIVFHPVLSPTAQAQLTPIQTKVMSESCASDQTPVSCINGDKEAANDALAAYSAYKRFCLEVGGSSSPDTKGLFNGCAAQLWGTGANNVGGQKAHAQTGVIHACDQLHAAWTLLAPKDQKNVAPYCDSQLLAFANTQANPPTSHNDPPGI